MNRKEARKNFLEENRINTEQRRISTEEFQKIRRELFESRFLENKHKGNRYGLSRTNEVGGHDAR